MAAFELPHTISLPPERPPLTCLPSCLGPSALNAAPADQAAGGAQGSHR